MPPTFGYVRIASLATSVFLFNGQLLMADVPGPSSRRTSWVISEVMYHPTPLRHGQELEFVEVYNAGLITEDLAGYRLSGDWDFVFPTNTVVAAGGYVVVAPAPTDRMAAYGINGVLGGFTNRLANDRGLLRLRNPANAILLEVEYADTPPWPAAADGGGHSLVLSRPGFGERDPRAWTASSFVRGSPGQAETSVPADAPIGMINELLTHTDHPQLDYIEILNPSERAIDYSGCRLTDDPAKAGFRIPSGVLLPPRGLVGFDQNQLGFALDAAGETVFLVSADDQRVLDAIKFGPQANGVSFGRWPDGSLRWGALSSPTFASTNTPPRQPEVVISEIFYHPISEDADDEFLELHNPGTLPVDLSGWELQDGIEFVFPPGIVLPGGGYLAVARDAARLLANHPGLTAQQFIGNNGGTLSDAGERVALARPELLITTNTDLTLATKRVAIVVNEVTYGDGGRWGRWSDGGGSSLELRDARADNRLPSAWADSDESSKAPWTLVESSGTLDLGVGSIDSLQVLLQGPGACLVDDVQVLTADSVNHLANGGFPTGTAGWVFEGTHAASHFNADEGASAPGSLNVQAVGRGDTGANRIRTPVTAGLSVGATATLRASARWQRGSPDLLLRLRGNYLEAAGRIMVPANLGTPGQPNSRAELNAPPAIWDVAHEPVLPRAGGVVRVSARVRDPDGLDAVELRYRVDPAATYSILAMYDDGTSGDRFAGDGLYTATLPAQTSGRLVAYQVYARDASAAAPFALFPDEAPRVEALIRYGETRPAGQLGVYRLWMTAGANLIAIAGVDLNLTTVIDAAAVFHLNGQPIHWLGLSSNTPIDYATLSERNVPDATQEGPFQLDSTYLRPGDNVFAVEVHQVAITSSDITFGLTLEAVARASGAAATPGRPNATLRSLPAIPNLWINELQSVNTAGPRDRFDETEPWVELFNAGTTAASLDGCYLTDSTTNLTRWAFPSRTMVGPGQWLVVWLDAEPQETGNGELHASFRPSGGVGFLALVATVAGQPFVLDSIHYAGLQDGYALSLLPDGNPDDRRVILGATPGAINSVLPGPTGVRVNEWMAVNQGAVADPADGDYDDWLELHNAFDVPADLTGCFLTDDPSDPHQYAIPAGTVIPARGFLLCWADEEGGQTVPGGPLHLNFRLSQSGEQLLLVSPNGTVLDTVTFGQQNIDRTEGRWPDGGSNLARLSLPTPGSATAGGVYRLQVRDELTVGDWQDVTADLLASGSSLSTTALASPSTERYYRIVRLMP